MYLWAEQAAYKQRGYQAYGGEYILAVIAGVVSHCALQEGVKMPQRKWLPKGAKQKYLTV